MQRNIRSLSFSPLVPGITQRVLGLDGKAVEILGQNLDPEPGEARGFLADMRDLVGKALGHGQYLNMLSCDASQELRSRLCEFASSLKHAQKRAAPVDLLLFLRQIVTPATATFLFGPQNPISLHPGLEDAFWAFDHGLGKLMMGIVPSLTASKAYRGRERLVASFKSYLEDGRHQYASKIVQDRIGLEQEYDMSQESIARSALSFLFAGVVNTTTTAYWIVLRLFADAELLTAVRLEIQRALRASTEQFGPNHLSITALKDSCPTLMAVFRESLRVGSENISVRLVREDVLLDNRYFLKKGSVVEIAGGVIHANGDIWGEDVDSFKPERFMTQRDKGSCVHPAAFRGFGGGKTLCPGRYFATNEILVLVAMVVHCFSMTGSDGGVPAVPPKDDGVMPVHVLEPQLRKAPKVTITLRGAAQLLDSLQVVT